MLKNKKIKVCLVSPFAYTLFNSNVKIKFGGAEVQMYLIANELAKDTNFKVDFIVLNLGQKKNEIYNNVHVHIAYKRGRGILNLIKAPLQLFVLLYKLSPDVIINRAHGVETGICAFYAKYYKRKFIYSIAHDKDVDKSHFIKLRGKIFKYGFEKADYYIAQSQRQKEILEKTYEKKFDNLQVISNSYNLQKTLKLEKDIVLWVGSSINLKRPELFLELAKKFPNEKFVMIMTKSISAINVWHEIKKEASKLNNLEFIESVPFDKINKYFSKAKIFINTSIAEGFPNTFLQSMIAKTPILSLKVDPDNFIINNKCGLVCNDDINELKRKLKVLLQDEMKRKEMGENGLKYVTKNHNIKNNIVKWKKVIN